MIYLNNERSEEAMVRLRGRARLPGHPCKVTDVKYLLEGDKRHWRFEALVHLLLLIVVMGSSFLTE